MHTDKRLDLAILWHMHQPDYRDHDTGEFRLPWVYLHALKDYSDMAAHLEQNPGIRATVNFVPVLLDQLADYAGQFATGQLRDSLLRLLARDVDTPLAPPERELALDRCFRANHDKMIRPFPVYKLLHSLAQRLESEGGHALSYLSDQFFFDLVTWYHIGWTGEAVRRESQLVQALMHKGGGFTLAERRALLELVGGVVSGVLPRWRTLAESGRIEVSTTPYTHPIAPLLLDFGVAREAEPDAPLPSAPAYPGGRDRVAAQLDAAIATHVAHFGTRPTGVWPAEGALSEELAAMLAKSGIAWTASGEQVLAHSLHRSQLSAGARRDYLYRPYHLPEQAPGLALFFRDDRLSDLIGFEYARWNSDDAAAAFIVHLETIAAIGAEGERPLVTVMLDGENAWEFYPYNGWYFLSDTYARLAAHPRIATVTLSEAAMAAAGVDHAQRRRAAPGTLGRLVAGSWVYGNFALWIGTADKNAAWDLLCAAKQAVDRALAANRLEAPIRNAVLRQLAICESSDWFWWFGSHNPAPEVAVFDALFRANIAALYELLMLPPPPELAQPVSRGSETTIYEGAIRRAS